MKFHHIWVTLAFALASVMTTGWRANSAAAQECADAGVVTQSADSRSNRAQSAQSERPLREMLRQRAQTAPNPAAEARQFARLRVSGDQLRDRAAQMNELEWHSSLDAAKAAAQAASKPIVWIQILGNFDGFT